MSFAEFTTKTGFEVLKQFKSSSDGLSEKEAVLRQKQYGANELKAKNVNVFEILLRQLKSPFAFLLLAAAAVSLVVGGRTDFYVMAVIVLVNIAIGFFQEYRAEKAIFLLNKFIPEKTKILRSGKEEFVERKDIVPGDIMLVESGDKIPADARILEVENFLVDESSLTGESVPVSKIVEPLKMATDEIFRAKNMLFAGTSIISGKAKAVVVGTGKDSAVGQIAKMVSGQNKISAYEKSIIYFCKLVLRVVLVTIILLFTVNLLLKGFGVFFDLLLFSVALVVSILPEALPAVVTFSLSKGSLEMAKRHVVVRRLSAIEDMGNIEVLCTDKTGTLTENKLTLEKIVSSDKRKCLLYGLLSSEVNDHKISSAQENILNPFDLALFEKSPEEFWKEYKKYEIIFELPFDSYRMRAGYVVKNSRNEKFLIVKGAPEVILNLCSKIGDKSTRKEILEDAKREGEEGRRVLAIGFKKIEKESITEKDEKSLTFLGYFVFEDPLKKSTEEAVKLARKLGVKIKIITGDSKEVAVCVAKKMKLISNSSDAISARELEELLPDEFDEVCVEKQVFARISPEMKYKIVKSLQKRYDVGFLGEGINDAPALKAANVAIVVQSASDVSREVSDVVLLKKDLKVIVEGIRLGRTIYSNINKYIKSMLASNFGNFYSVAIISLFINYLPMLPVQILLVNLMSDFPLVSIATDSVDVEELRKPKTYQLSSVLPLIILLAVVSTIFDFIFFSIFSKYGPDQMRTLWFVESIMTELCLVYIIRSVRPIWKATKPSFVLLCFSITDGVVVLLLPFFTFAQNIFHFVTPSIFALITVFGIVGTYAVLSEFAKNIYFKFFKNQKLDGFLDVAVDK